MLILLYVLQVATLATVGVLAWQVLRLRRSAKAIADQSAGLSPAPPALAALQPPAPSPDLISIEILNPMEVARAQSKLAQAFGTMVPAIVRAEVYRQARLIILDELKERGVVAEVRVHRVP